MRILSAETKGDTGVTEVTPMMKQYLQVKEKYSDCILFYRLGDFYEMFNDDARIASRELELVLTGRGGKKGDEIGGESGRIPMCGVPFHSADSYIVRLVSKGYKVAICEQTEDPALAKGLVSREVVKIVTPGTLTDARALDEKKNNFLALIYTNDEDETALVFADISTGELFATKLKNAKSDSVSDEIAGYNPSEIIFNSKARSLYLSDIKSRFDTYIGDINEDFFDYDMARSALADEMDSSDLSLPEISADETLTCGIGAAIMYLCDTQKSSLFKIMNIKRYETAQFMGIDYSTRRNLELTASMREKSKKGTLLWVLDKTKTSMGGRMLAQWIEKPLLSSEQIKMRLEGVRELKENIMLREEICECLDKIYDISRLINRISLGSASPRDMISLRDSLGVLPEIKFKLSQFNSDILDKQYKHLDVMADIKELLEAAVSDEPPVNARDGGVIKSGYNENVDEYRRAQTEGKSWIADIQSSEREKTGIKTLKVGYNKVFGYYIEVSKGQVSAVPDYYVRKQTLVNGERYITPKLKEIENIIIGAEDRLIRLELHLFDELKKQVCAQIERLKNTAEVIATIDVLSSFAYVAEQNDYVMPVVDNSDVTEIKDGRHPVVEKMLKNELFVPNDTYLNTSDDRMCIITGPNMAGKSTYMRQVALITLMAQIGSFVPASSAKIGIVDKIFTRVGASDDLATGQSTFMVEMNEVTNILKNATKNSLVILDEIGRGTSTYDGLSIAWAVAEYICDKEKIGAKTLFSTHYHELTELENRLAGVKNYCIAVKKRGDNITFLRKIIRGGADGSYGIEVAALAGIPSDVTVRAKEIFSALEKNDVNKGSYQLEGIDTVNYALLNMKNDSGNEVIEELKRLDVTTYTPIEALNKLYELTNKAKDM